MRKTLLAFALFAFAAVQASAVQAKFVCTFDPPADVAVGEAGVEYSVEALQPNGTWLQVASGPGVATGQAVGKLGISYESNVPFGDYVVRVRVIKPIVGPVSDNAPALQIVPGKPQNVKSSSSRGTVSQAAPAVAPHSVKIVSTTAKPAPK